MATGQWAIQQIQHGCTAHDCPFDEKLHVPLRGQRAQAAILQGNGALVGGHNVTPRIQGASAMRDSGLPVIQVCECHFTDHIRITLIDETEHVPIPAMATELSLRLDILQQLSNVQTGRITNRTETRVRDTGDGPFVSIPFPKFIFLFH